MVDDEEASPSVVKPQTEARPWVSAAHANPWRPAHPQSSSAKGSPAAYPGVKHVVSAQSISPIFEPLKRTELFRTVYRRGRWAHGRLLSVGVFARSAPTVRVGLRTKRGLKGAVRRNRLKRQLRALIFSGPRPLFRPGLDIVIVIHPDRESVLAASFSNELDVLSRRLRTLPRNRCSFASSRYTVMHSLTIYYMHAGFTQRARNTPRKRFAGMEGCAEAGKRSGDCCAAGRWGASATIQCHD
jgi:ribonuclease P protein component